MIIVTKKLKQDKESFLNLDDCFNTNYNYESLRSRLVSQPNSNKNNKNFVSSTKEDWVPITFNELIPKDQICQNNSKNVSNLQNDVHITSWYINILMDSGASASIICNSFVHTNKFNTRKTSANKWSTMDGSFSMLCEAEVKIKLPELNFTAHIFTPFHITCQKSNYNVILGRDLLWGLDINLDFQNNFVYWTERNKDTHDIN